MVLEQRGLTILRFLNLHHLKKLKTLQAELSPNGP